MYICNFPSRRLTKTIGLFGVFINSTARTRTPQQFSALYSVMMSTTTKRTPPSLVSATTTKTVASAGFVEQADPIGTMSEIKVKLDGRTQVFPIELWRHDPGKVVIGRWVAPEGGAYGLPAGAYSWGVFPLAPPPPVKKGSLLRSNNARSGNGNIEAPSETASSDVEEEEGRANIRSNLRTDGRRGKSSSHPKTAETNNNGNQQRVDIDKICDSMTGTEIPSDVSWSAYRLHGPNGSLLGYRFDVIKGFATATAPSSYLFSSCTSSATKEYCGGKLTNARVDTDANHTTKTTKTTKTETDKDTETDTDTYLAKSTKSAAAAAAAAAETSITATATSDAVNRKPRHHRPTVVLDVRFEDLVLDFRVTPDGEATIEDVEELESAVAAGLISQNLADRAMQLQAHFEANPIAFAQAVDGYLIGLPGRCIGG